MSARWHRWRQSRYQSLAAEGLPLGIAAQIADAETNKRRALARLLGAAEVKDAVLLVTDDGNDGLRFVIASTMLDPHPGESIKDGTGREWRVL